LAKKPPGSNQELWAKSLQEAIRNYDGLKRLQEGIRNYGLKAFRRQ
jgi:hypothetical protein